MQVTAINTKWQSKVNAFLRADKHYNKLVQEGREDTVLGDKVYDKAYTILLELPAREVRNIPKEIRECYK